MAKAQWRPLYQTNKGVYTVQKRANAKPVVDVVDIDDQNYVRHYDVKLNQGKHPTISARTRKQLAAQGLQYHVLGHTYP